MNKDIENLKVISVVITLLILASLILPINATSLLIQAGGRGQAGTSLEANVTALAVNLTRYEWSISKSANTSEVYLSRSNPTATVEYTVAANKTTTQSYYIEGQVCVKNKGDVSTAGLSISLDVFVGRGWDTLMIDDYPIDVSAKPVLDPDESYCYYYRVDIPSNYWNYGSFKVTANVTITNHSGWLGQPFGPRPSNTTSKTDVTYGWDCVNVTDTNGYSWSTCVSSSWTYSLTFIYDPKRGDYYEHDNTATIVQTGQSVSWTVKVRQVIERRAKISGVVFWDNDYDGVYDVSDKPISSVTVMLYRYNEATGEWDQVGTTSSGEDGKYYFEVDIRHKYKVEVVKPYCEFCDVVVSTTPTYYVVDAGEAKPYDGNDFGFICLKKLTGAYSKGYWSWSQYNRRTGQWSTRVTSVDVSYINSEIGTSFGSPKELADYLISPVLGDMATALRQQLIATLLNLKYGYVGEDTVIYYDGRYITINEVVGNAKSALERGSRYEQEYWKDLLDAINNNYIYYVYEVK